MFSEMLCLRPLCALCLLVSVTPHFNMSMFSAASVSTSPSLEDRLLLRAAVDRAIRTFFDTQGMLEVHVPTMVPVPGMEEHLSAFKVHSTTRALWEPRWLHTSPEFAIKEVFSQIERDIYCMARVYRDEPCGPHHSPEFMMVEWYRHDVDYTVLMEDTEQLISAVLRAVLGTNSPRVHGQDLTLRFDRPIPRVRWVDAFAPYIDKDPLTASRDAWAQALESHGIVVSETWDRDTVLSMFWAEVIEATFAKEPIFLIEFPADQAALARLSPHDSRVAERFELYVPGPWDRHPGWGGVELANAFSELIDPVEQRQRFEACIEQRDALGVAPFPMPEDLLTGLETLGECSGIALGVDRLATWIGQTFLGWQVSVYDFYCTLRSEG